MIEDIVAAVIGVALLAYLLLALIWPEWF
ncbi:MAG TPA: K(+)-transporting ATPase subunit F [Intrasporangiaceae bacterium]|nr:K(+)-transporting ATPase subunit F [Intrasporangiaceae bacterium]